MVSLSTIFDMKHLQEIRERDHIAGYKDFGLWTKEAAGEKYRFLWVP